MAFDDLKHSKYFDPPYQFPFNARDLSDDLNEYHIPLERLHNASCHDWGVAAGLEVSGAAGAAELIVSEGVAIAGSGDAICLSTNGHGDIGANPLATPPQSNRVATPVHLPLAGFGGQTLYVTIQYSEYLEPTSGSGGKVVQAPWVRLQPAATYTHDGTAIVLAVVRVTAGATVDWLKTDDSSLPHGRRLIGQNVSAVRVTRPVKTGTVVDDTTSGTLTAGTGGGLELRVPGGGDSITLARDGNQNFASLVARANSVVVKDSAGNDALHMAAGTGTLTIGSNGREGNLNVKDSSDRATLHFDANSASLYVGASGNEGDLIVRDGSGVQSTRIDGNTGTVHTKRLAPQGGTAIDVDASFFRIHGIDLCLDGRSGGNKRALVDYTNKLIVNFGNDYSNGVETPGDLRIGGLLTVNGRRVAGNPARYVSARWLFIEDGTTTETVDLGSTRQVFACVVMTGCDPQSGFDRGDAYAFDIFRVDGTRTGRWLSGGDHFGAADNDSNVFAQTWQGQARTILFRARSWQDAYVWGLGLVFYE